MGFLKNLLRKSPEQLQDRVIQSRQKAFQAAERSKDWVDTLKAKKHQLETSDAQRMRLQLKLKSYLKSLQTAAREPSLREFVREEILTHLNHAYGCYLATCALSAFIYARYRGSFPWQRNGNGVANPRKFSEMHIPTRFQMSAKDLRQVIDMQSSLLSSLGMEDDIPAWETDIAQYQDVSVGVTEHTFRTGYKADKLINKAQKYAPQHPLVQAVSDPALFTPEFYIDLPNQH